MTHFWLVAAAVTVREGPRLRALNKIIGLRGTR